MFLVAQEKFSESTLGVPTPKDYEPPVHGNVSNLPDAKLWKELLHTKKFRISVVPDAEGVGLCGALKSEYNSLKS
jgi:glycerol-3-phosphate dehydrogenase